MRNSKVRKRLAAGKLRLRIRDLRNLGPRSETLLAPLGIHTADQLRARGAMETFVALRRRDPTASSLNLLWALVGALDPWPEGTDWREIASSEQRLPLLLQLENRDQARNAVLEAAGVTAPKAPAKAVRVRKKPAAVAADGVEPEAPLGDWAPGLPFEEGGAGRKSGH